MKPRWELMQAAVPPGKCCREAGYSTLNTGVQGKLRREHYAHSFNGVYENWPRSSLKMGGGESAGVGF